jgi:hypothetical protein
MNGSNGLQRLEVPIALKSPEDGAAVQLNIPALTGGTVTASREAYQVGDTVVLTVTPNAGFCQKLFINGENLVLDSNTQSYSFVATEEVYHITGSFEPSLFNIVYGNWDLRDQLHGRITITDQKDGTTVLTNVSAYQEVSVTVKDHTPSKNSDGTLKQGNFSMQISFVFDNGKSYQVRMHNTDKDGNYKLQNMGGTNSITGWKWQADLTTAQKQKLLEGDGVEFRVKLVGANAELWVDGSLMKTVALGAEYDGKLVQIKLCMNGNSGVKNIVIPFTLQ